MRNLPNEYDCYKFPISVAFYFTTFFNAKKSILKSIIMGSVNYYYFFLLFVLLFNDTMFFFWFLFNTVNCFHVTFFPNTNCQAVFVLIAVYAFKNSLVLIFSHALSKTNIFMITDPLFAIIEQITFYYRKRRVILRLLIASIKLMTLKQQVNINLIVFDWIVQVKYNTRMLI